MINDETPRHLVALAHRLVGLPGWCWAEGMLDTFGRRVVSHQPDQSWLLWSDGSESDGSEATPDLSDRPTLGAIALELLPEAWGPGAITSVKWWTADDGTTMADVHVHRRDDACAMLFGVVDVPLAEALVQAMEAAAEWRVEA